MLQVEQKGIEDVLFESGKLTKDQLSLVKMESINSGKTVDEILLSRNLATKEDIAKSKGQQLGFEYVDPTAKPIPADVLSKIPEPVGSTYSKIGRAHV